MTTTVRDQLAALIRTWVPVGIGLILTMLARKWDIVLDDTSSAGLTAGAAALVTAVYYALVRILEQRWKPLGWLLGLAVRPQYESKALSDTPERPAPENGAQGL